MALGFIATWPYLPRLWLGKHMGSVRYVRVGPYATWQISAVNPRSVNIVYLTSESTHTRFCEWDDVIFLTIIMSMFAAQVNTLLCRRAGFIRIFQLASRAYVTPRKLSIYAAKKKTLKCFTHHGFPELAVMKILGTFIYLFIGLFID